MAVVFNDRQNYCVYTPTTDPTWELLTDGVYTVTPTVNYQGYVGTAAQEDTGTGTLTSPYADLCVNNHATYITGVDYDNYITAGTPTVEYTNSGQYTAINVTGTLTAGGGWDILTGTTVQGTGGAITQGVGYQGTAGYFINGGSNVVYTIPLWGALGDKKSMHRAKTAFNLAPKANTRENLFKADAQERVALETLREFVTETEFRKYLKYGFVLVKGRSGDSYQIFRNRSHTKVYRGSKLVEEICVRIRGDQKVPPTDNVIAFKTMIEAGDELEFKRLGNVYKMAA